MRKVEFKVYKLNELPEKSREAAYNKWFDNFEYVFKYDNRKTLEAFERIFDVKVNDWSYDMNSFHYRFITNHNEDEDSLSGVRLLKYIVNSYWDTLFKPKMYYSKDYKKKRRSSIFIERDYTLTGYGADWSILDPIYKFIKNPGNNTTLYDLMDECLKSYFESCSENVRYEYSKEHFVECCELNEYEFFEDGSMYV